MNDEVSSNISALLARVALGDQTAFAELHRYYWHEIFTLALSFLKSPELAEDILQEVFVKLWLKREDLPSIEDFTPYLMVMVRNEVISFLRRNTVQEKLKRLYWENNAGENTIPDLSSGDTAVLIAAALARLPEKQQYVFNLSREKGLSHEQIAKETGLSPKTVSNTITIVLNHLRIFLHRKGYLGWICYVLSDHLIRCLKKL